MPLALCHFLLMAAPPVLWVMQKHVYKLKIPEYASPTTRTLPIILLAYG